MSVALRQQVTEDLQSAMRARDSVRVTALRMWVAAIRQKETERRRTELDEGGVHMVLNRLVRQYQGAIEQYRQAGRFDLVEKEQAELAVLQGYLPPALSEEELDRQVREVIGQTGASTLKDMGRVMEQLGASLQGRADMKQVSSKVRELLA